MKEEFFFRMQGACSNGMIEKKAFFWKEKKKIEVVDLSGFEMEG